MNNYQMDLRFLELQKELTEVMKTLDKALLKVRSEKELWDNADIIKNWKVSERTLAGWRKKGLISYVQVQNKIYYPEDAREEFLKNHLIRENLDNGRTKS